MKEIFVVLVRSGAKPCYLMPIRDLTEKEIKNKAALVRIKTRGERVEKIKNGRN